LSDTLGTLRCIAFAVSRDPARRSLGPFVEEILKPRGKHGDFGGYHCCHVLFALGLETLNDGSEFRDQLFHADRLVLLENSVVGLVPDLLNLDLDVVLVIALDVVHHPSRCGPRDSCYVGDFSEGAPLLASALLHNSARYIRARSDDQIALQAGSRWLSIRVIHAVEVPHNAHSLYAEITPTFGDSLDG
jgi:hypothetical protein